MTPTVIEIDASKFSAELTQLLSDSAEGKYVDLDESWVYDFFSDEIDFGNYDCVCIHESYLKDWVFRDHDVLEYLESDSELVSDSQRVAHARTRVRGLLEYSEEAPVMFFIDLHRSGVRRASVIISWHSAGQGGWYYTFVSSFVDGSYSEELAKAGFIDLDELENIEDQWILDRWVHED